MNSIEGTRLWPLSEGGQYRRNPIVGHYRTVGTIRKLAHWRETGGGDRSCRETGGGDRSNAIVGTVAILAAVIDWARKADLIEQSLNPKFLRLN